MSLSADQREAIAGAAFALLKPFDRYAILPGPENRIVDINLDDPHVIDALAGWLGEARRDGAAAERERIRIAVELMPDHRIEAPDGSGWSGLRYLDVLDEIEGSEATP